MIYYIDTIAKAKRLLKPLEVLNASGEKYLIEVDLETYNKQGLNPGDPHTALVRSIQLNWGEDPVIIDLMYIDSYDDFIRSVLVNPNALKIAHNAKFEYKFCVKRFNVRMNNIWCTLLGAKMMERGNRYILGYGLKDVLYRASKGEIDLDKQLQASDWSKRVLEPKQLEYMAADVKYLRRLYKYQLSHLERFQRHLRVAQLEMDLIPVFGDMELAGMLLDKKEIKNLKERYNLEVSDQLKILQELMPFVPPSSKTEAVSKKFKEQYPDGVRPVKNLNDFKMALKMMGLKIPTLFDRKSGKIRESLSATTYEKIEDPNKDRNIGHKLQIYSEKNSLLTKYFNKMDSWIHPVTKRVHFSVNQVLVTGRISISDPPIQQMPHGIWFRKSFIAQRLKSSRKKLLIKLDYSQLELRLMAYASQDTNMLSEYQKGLEADLHTLTAKFIYNVKKPTKEQRTDAKPVNFGCLYGQTPSGLQQYCLQYGLHFTIDECKEFINGFLDRGYPKVKGFQLWYAGQLLECFHSGKGFVGETYGGRQRLWAWDDLKNKVKPTKFGGWRAFPNEQINFPIQGTAGDGMKRSQLRIWRYNIKNKLMKHVKMILQMHDELVFEVPETEAKELGFIYAQMMEEEMQKILMAHPNGNFPWMASNYRVPPIYVDLGIGENWGETEAVPLLWHQ